MRSGFSGITQISMRHCRSGRPPLSLSLTLWFPKRFDPMKLSAPFLISARLLPAVSIGKGEEQITVSLSPSGFILDGPFGEHRVTDLTLRGNPSMESAFETLLSFMTAAAESFRYRVTEALFQVSTELECVWADILMAIESGEELVTEEEESWFWFPEPLT
jgi:hypothetical protein